MVSTKHIKYSIDYASFTITILLVISAMEVSAVHKRQRRRQRGDGGGFEGVGASVAIGRRVAAAILDRAASRTDALAHGDDEHSAPEARVTAAAARALADSARSAAEAVRPGGRRD